MHILYYFLNWQSLIFFNFFTYTVFSTKDISKANNYMSIYNKSYWHLLIFILNFIILFCAMVICFHNCVIICTPIYCTYCNKYSLYIVNFILKRNQNMFMKMYNKIIYVLYNILLSWINLAVWIFKNIKFVIYFWPIITLNGKQFYTLIDISRFWIYINIYYYYYFLLKLILISHL